MYIYLSFYVAIFIFKFEFIWKKKKFINHFIHLFSMYNIILLSICQSISHYRSIEIFVFIYILNKELSSFHNINICDWLGSTPLHDAAKNGYEAIVEILTKNGADIHQKNRDGKNMIFIYIYQLINISICLYIYISIHLSIYKYIYIYYLSIIYQFIFVSIYLFYIITIKDWYYLSISNLLKYFTMYLIVEKG